MTCTGMSSYTRIIHLQCEFVALQGITGRYGEVESGEEWQDNKVAYELQNCFITERVLTENKGAHYKLHCYTRNLAGESLLQRTRTWPGCVQEVSGLRCVNEKDFRPYVSCLVSLSFSSTDLASPEWLFNI